MKRRSLFKAIGKAIGAALGALIVVPLAGVLGDPLRRKTQTSVDEAVPVADLAKLADGVPMRASVNAPVLRDAWTRLEDVPLGAVWLVRRGDSVCALSTTCPHAGCFVDYAADTKDFRCPCHQSRFGLDGARVDGPAPRAMDQLETNVKDGKVLVRWQRFRQAKADKEPV